MQRTGPEALMVLSRRDAGSDLARYARLEYGCDDLRIVAAGRWTEADDPAVGGSAVGSLILRAHDWLRGRGRRDDRGEGAAEVRAEERPAGAPAALWAIPMLEAAPPERAR